MKIPKAVRNITPKEFFDLNDDSRYKLTKLMSFRHNSTISVGDSSVGTISIVQHIDSGLPRLHIQRSPWDYLLTSPIVRVKDKTEDSIIFETEGGIYKLEEVRQDVRN